MAVTPSGAQSLPGEDGAAGQLDYSVRAIDRLLDVMELLAESSARAHEVSAKLGIPKATTFRLLTNLEERGFVQRDRETGEYSLSFKLFHLGLGAFSHRYPVDLVRPYLWELAQRTKETSQLWILDGDEIVVVSQFESSQAVRFSSALGRRLPLHVAAVGWCVLAHLPESFQEDYLARPLPSLTPHTLTNRDVLRRELIHIRSRGYAFSHDGVLVGSAGIAAPVRNAWGEVDGAINLLGPTQRIMASPEFDELTRLVVEASERISAVLGGNRTMADRSSQTDDARSDDVDDPGHSQ